MNTRVYSVSLAILTLILASCKEVTFPEPQPKGVEPLKELPRVLHGQYVADDPSEEKKDTLIVESWGYHFRDSRDKDWLGKGVISDSLVIKHYKEYYFINFRAENRWVLRVVHRQPSGSLDFLSLNVQDEEKEADLIKKLSRSVEVKKNELNGDTFYEINPTRDQLMSFIEKGYFTGIVLHKK